MEHQIILGDCLDPVTGMVQLADRSVDCFITDPPYSEALYSRTRTNRGTGLRPDGRPVSKSEGDPGTSAFVLASKKIGAIDGILADVAAQALRLTARWVVVFSDIETAPEWRGALGDWYLRTGIWLKTDPMPQVSGDRPAQGFEAATIGHRPGRKRWNGGGRPAVWTHGTVKGTARPDHPCPKPLALMEALIRDFTDPGDLVCDPFAGSGTTGVACKRLGRRFIGWERDPAWAFAAQRRIDGAREQLTLGGLSPVADASQAELPILRTHASAARVGPIEFGFKGPLGESTEGDR